MNVLKLSLFLFVVIVCCQAEDLGQHRVKRWSWGWNKKNLEEQNTDVTTKKPWYRRVYDHLHNRENPHEHHWWHRKDSSKWSAEKPTDTQGEEKEHSVSRYLKDHMSRPWHFQGHGWQVHIPAILPKKIETTIKPIVEVHTEQTVPEIQVHEEKFVDITEEPHVETTVKHVEIVTEIEDSEIVTENTIFEENTQQDVVEEDNTFVTEVPNDINTATEQTQNEIFPEIEDKNEGIDLRKENKHEPKLHMHEDKDKHIHNFHSMHNMYPNIGDKKEPADYKEDNSAATLTNDDFKKDGDISNAEEQDDYIVENMYD